MADITTPASFSYTGGMLRTRRVVPARLRFTAGNVTSARDTALGSSVAVPNLDRLTFSDRIPGEDELSFMRRVSLWQTHCDNIEGALEAINARVDDLAAIVARLAAAETLAQAANDSAAAAQTTVAVVQAAAQDTFTQIDPTYGDVFADRVSTL